MHNKNENIWHYVAAIITFFSLVITSYCIDYNWKKFVIKQAIKEVQQEQKDGK